MYAREQTVQNQLKGDCQQRPSQLSPYTYIHTPGAYVGAQQHTTTLGTQHFCVPVGLLLGPALIYQNGHHRAELQHLCLLDFLQKVGQRVVRGLLDLAVAVAQL
jgi:hypothetical protein